ncbi:MAG: glutamate-5-semialdehyde dehydrogenase [Paracoccaceae bacterium]
MTNKVEILLKSLGKNGKIACHLMSNISSYKKNKTLKSISKIIEKNKNFILKANKLDLNNATKNKLNSAKIDRLSLNEERIKDIQTSLYDIINFEDPINKILESRSRPSGIKIKKISTPIGLIGIIYESRPNVTIDAAALCIKSSNSAILRPGSESYHSSFALFNCINEGLVKTGLPEHLIQIIPTTNRIAVKKLIQMTDYIDVIIPRGGKNLVKLIQDTAKVPVFAHLEGIVHTYIHEDADPKMVEKLVLNSKLRRPGICGSLECLLINKTFFQKYGSNLVNKLLDNGVEIRGDKLVSEIDGVKLANYKDWGREFLDKILSVKVTDNLKKAIEHINRYNSNHTDSIITNNKNIAKQFCSEIDSAILMHNVSTQFADGGEFGMGAEIGIGTGKLHARGPIGAKELTSFKFIVEGNGILRK